jgi:hypothetical protein
MRQIVFKGLYILLVFTFLTSCSKKLVHFVPTQAPPVIEVPENVNMKLVGPPPQLMPENANPVLDGVPHSITSLVIMPIVDNTNEYGSYLGQLKEMLNTSLMESDRFQVMIEGLSDAGNISLATDTGKVNKKGASKEIDYNGIDAYLVVVLSSSSKRSSHNEVSAEFRILNYKNEMVYAGFGVLRFSNKDNVFERESIISLAENVKEKYPEAGKIDGAYVVKRMGDNIMLNCGKDKGLKPGLMGYVIREDNGRRKTKSANFKCLFEITEVFENSCNANLIYQTEEEEYVARYVKIMDPVLIK